MEKTFELLTFEELLNLPIDIESCFDPIFEPLQELIDKWQAAYDDEPDEVPTFYVTEGDFETVQQQIVSRRRECKNKTSQIFSGLLKCSDCGWAMRYCARIGKSGKYKYYQTRGCRASQVRMVSRNRKLRFSTASLARLIEHRNLYP